MTERTEFTETAVLNRCLRTLRFRLRVALEFLARQAEPV